MRILSYATVFVWILAAGCENAQQWKWSGQKTPAPASTDSQEAGKADTDAEVEMLQEKVTELENEKAVLQGELRDLRAREKILADKVQELKFANQQQARQLETLRKVPAERDMYKEQLEALRLRVKILERKLAGGESTAATQADDASRPESTTEINAETENTPKMQSAAEGDTSSGYPATVPAETQGATP